MTDPSGATDPSADEAVLADRPVLRVVRGTPDAYELAALVALVAVVGSASGGGVGDPPLPTSEWAAPQRMVRSTLPSGGWRSSFAPR